MNSESANPLLDHPPTRDGDVATFCRICEPLCGLRVTVHDGVAVSIKGDPDNPESRGYLCPKGAAIASVAYDSDRVLTPLKRVGGPGEFEPCDWDTALDDIAAKIRRIVDLYGPNAVAMYYGNPGAYSIGGFAWSAAFLAGIGSTQKYTAMHQDAAPRATASHFLYGNGGIYPIPDIPHVHTLLIFGGNPLVSHGSLVSIGRIREELHDIVHRGGRVVVIDPAATKTAKEFEHVPIRPGSDVWLLGAMINTIIDRGLHDTSAIARQSDGFGALAEAIKPLTADAASRNAGVPVAVTEQLALDFARSPAAVAYGRTGVCRGEFSTLTNYLLDALSVITGNFDRRGGLLIGRGLVDNFAMWAKMKRGGYGSVRTRLEHLPDILGIRPYVLPQEITTPGEDQIRGFICCAGNPVLSAPAGDQLEAGLEELELSVAVDLYVTETSKHAHYILPTTTFLERFDSQIFFGSFMPRPWAQATPPVIEPCGDVRQDWWIFNELMRRLGITPPAENPQHFVDQMLTANPANPADPWSLERLAQYEHGVRIEQHVTLGDSADRLRIAFGGYTDKVQLGVPDILSEASRLVAAASLDRPVGTLLLIGQRDLRSINSWLHNVRTVKKTTIPALRINPVDAEARSIRTGDHVKISTSTGSIDVEAEVTNDIIAGSVAYPHGWGHAGGWDTANRHGGGNYNQLVAATADRKEALSGASILDGVPVTVARLVTAETAK